MYNPELEGYSAWLRRHASALAQTYNAAFDTSVCGTMHKVIYEL